MFGFNRRPFRSAIQKALLWTAAALILASGAPAHAQYTYQTAVHLGVLDGMGSVNGSVGINGLQQVQATISNGQTMWYKFTLPDVRNTTVRLDSHGGTLTCMWWPVTGTIIDTLSVGPWLADISNAMCGAGDYWLVVQKTATGAPSSGFRLVAEAKSPTPDTAPNIQGQGRFLGTASSSPIQLTEYVGRFDWDDYYKVNVGANLNLNVQIIPQYSQYDIDLRVYGPSGMIVAQSVRAGVANEFVNFRVPSAGTYEVRVSTPYRNYTSSEHAWHQVRVFTTVSPTLPTPPPDLGGNSPSVATPVTMYAGFGNPLLERIGGNDPNDWYTFYMPLYPNAGYLNERGMIISIAGVTVPVTVSLYDARTGSLVLRNTAAAGPGGTATINSFLPIRTINGYFIPYYIHVSSASAVQGTYTITVSPQG